MGGEAVLKAHKIAEDIRSAGIVVTADRSGNLKKRLNRANKNNASFAIIIGDDELSSGTATVKSLDDGEQTQVPFTELAAAVAVKKGDNVTVKFQYLGTVSFKFV
ncbi:MAG: hypothetical protein JKX67_01470 [Colwellia sp.]|nr:hypothetical protein [Colwellia sp.]